MQHNLYQRSKLYKRDRVTYEHFGEEVPHVLVSNGRRLKQRVLYEVVSEDIEEVEERLIASCTNFINRYERYIKIKSLEEIVDRVELLRRMYELELQYQF